MTDPRDIPSPGDLSPIVCHALAHIHNLQKLDRLPLDRPAWWGTEWPVADLWSMYDEIYPYRDTLDQRLIDIDLGQPEDGRIVSRRPDKAIFIGQLPSGRRVVIDGNHRALNAIYWNEPTIPALIIGILPEDLTALQPPAARPNPDGHTHETAGQHRNP